MSNEFLRGLTRLIIIAGEHGRRTQRLGGAHDVDDRGGGVDECGQSADLTDRRADDLPQRLDEIESGAVGVVVDGSRRVLLHPGVQQALAQVVLDARHRDTGGGGQRLQIHAASSDSDNDLHYPR